ncbi:UNVERIFIED_CONTAM: hypothetical protein Slati_3024300 [Sesamum latifolium]|uniref:Uncharacterized protein n=1 Tax=Sesamum latifolium TaxID=2727402 RepID=A0AAW2VHN6_9LAMI
MHAETACHDGQAEGGGNSQQHTSSAGDRGDAPSPVLAGSTPVTLTQASPSPRVTGPTADPPRWSTSSDTSTEELSPALLGAIQQIVAAVLREHVSVTAPPTGNHTVRRRIPRGRGWRTCPSPSTTTRQKTGEPPARTSGGPATVAHPKHLQKGLQDIKYQIEGAPEDDRQGIPFTEVVMADELPMNCRTPAIAEYDGTADPMDHLSRRKLCKTELSLFAVRQKDNEPLKEYLQDSTLQHWRRDTPQRPKSDKFCCFHNDYGHTTEECRHLKNEIERLIQNGYLQEYVCWEKARGTGPYQKREGVKAKEIRASSPERSPKERARQASGRKGDDNNVPRKGVIRMITGDPSGGDSHRTRKSQIREAHDMSLKEVTEVEAMEDTPLIQFGRAERSGPRTSHNDALVIIVVFADYEVGRIFIDSGSSADILFGETYDKMQLGDVSREKVNTSLYGFAGEVVHPRGMISLPLTMGAGTTRKTCLLKFLVVDVPSAYNVILGRPTLTAFQAVIFIYHMKTKFPNPGGVGEVQGDHLQSRKCYVEAVRKGQKRNLDEDHQGVPSSKKGKETVAEGAPEEMETPAKVQPAEELLNIEVITGSPDKTHESVLT